MISIIIPVYNAEKFIEGTVKSVISQTYKDWELILVDDGSNDKSKEIIDSFKDERIKCVPNKSGRKGAAGARNYGVSIAEGRYIAFLDADDIWREGKLEKTFAFLQKKEAAFVFTAYDYGDKNARSRGKMVHVPEEMKYEQALSRTVIFTSTVMFDLEKISKKEISMPYIESEDTATWWNILRSGVTAYGLDDSLVIYRRSWNSLSANKIIAVRRIWRLYRNHENLGFFSSVYHLIGWAVRAVARRL